jgi:hypothetical protein
MRTRRSPDLIFIHASPFGWRRFAFCKVARQEYQGNLLQISYNGCPFFAFKKAQGNTAGLSVRHSEFPPFLPGSIRDIDLYRSSNAQ